jgi:hypothetical protein
MEHPRWREAPTPIASRGRSAHKAEIFVASSNQETDQHEKLLRQALAVDDIWIGRCDKRGWMSYPSGRDQQDDANRDAAEEICFISFEFPAPAWPRAARPRRSSHHIPTAAPRRDTISSLTMQGSFR